MTLREPTNVSHSDLVEATNASGFFQLLGMHIEMANAGKGKVSIWELLVLADPNMR